MRVAALVLALLSSRPAAADRILVVTATAGFRHDSIPTAEEVIAGIGASTGWFDVTYARTEQDVAQSLSPANLAGVRLVIFANTTGELPAAARQELLRWIAAGGSFIGVHSASDTWHSSPEYIAMLGGEFETHPDQAAVNVIVEDPLHRATTGLESPHPLFEEIYYFKNLDPSRVSMLLSLRASPENGAPGFFPLSWHKSHGAGRVLYTALGHRSDIWTSPWFRQHLTGAIAWALRREELPRKRGARR